MGRTVSGLMFIMAFLVTGCSSQMVNIDSPFTTYSHEAFVREGTGETGLAITGEPWCALIDLRGFRDTGMPLESPNEFLSWKNNRSVFVSVYAEKIDEATSEVTCRESIYKKIFNSRTDRMEIKTIGGRRVMYNVFEGRKQIDYCPFYRGYCFDFQFSMDARLSDKTIQHILESIVFVEDMSLGGKIQDIFYIYDKKIQMPVQNTWKYEFRAGLQSIPTIVFFPAKGDGFKMFLTVKDGFEKDTAADRAELKTAFSLKLDKWADRNADDPPIIEIFNDQRSLFITYFDVKDKHAHADDPTEYPYQRFGYMVLNRSAFTFTIFFRDEGRADVERCMKALEHLKMLDRDTLPVIDVVK